MTPILVGFVNVYVVQELCIYKQKTGKSVGPDDVCMEAIVNDGQSWLCT